MREEKGRRSYHQLGNSSNDRRSNNRKDCPNWKDEGVPQESTATFGNLDEQWTAESASATTSGVPDERHDRTDQKGVGAEPYSRPLPNDVPLTVWAVRSTRCRSLSGFGQHVKRCLSPGSDPLVHLHERFHVYLDVSDLAMVFNRDTFEIGNEVSVIHEPTTSNILGTHRALQLTMTSTKSNHSPTQQCCWGE